MAPTPIAPTLLTTIDMLNPSQVCERLLISSQTLLAMINAGQLRAYDFAGNIRFKSTDVETAHCEPQTK